MGHFLQKSPKDTLKTFLFNNSRSRFVLGSINVSVIKVTWGFLKLEKKRAE